MLKDRTRKHKRCCGKQRRKWHTEVKITNKDIFGGERELYEQGKKENKKKNKVEQKNAQTTHTFIFKHFFFTTNELWNDF